ncbi:MAG: sodium:proton antiporter [Gammaproteobacteria bacterium]|nr:MAG: sodium:proton antiporter [Gammaproteobacteria bacterium]
MDLTDSVLMLALVGLLAALSQWISWRSKIPSILFLLLGGIAVGPGLRLLAPDTLLGPFLFPAVIAAVGLILFEGSLTLDLHKLAEAAPVVRRLVTIGVVIGVFGITALAHWLVPLPWPLALLFGTLMLVTGPTVIIPMLRAVNPPRAVAETLKWEGILIDPLGALLGVLVYEGIVSLQQGARLPWSFALLFGEILVTGFVTGMLGAEILGRLLRSHRLPDYLWNLTTVATVVTVLAAANSLTKEAGLLAVTVMGIRMANMRELDVRAILNFKEELSLLLVSGLFILLAARLDPAALTALGMSAVLLLLGVQLLVRPLQALVASLGTQLSLRERILLAWIAPRGIVAAATAAGFAERLVARGYTGAELLIPLSFSLIIGTVLLQGITARPLAKALGLAQAARGVLIIGANRLARELALVLKQEGFEPLLLDSYWRNIRAARLAGLATFYGHPVSRKAELELDLVGFRWMLGLSGDPNLNAAAAQRFSEEFGRNHVFLLPVVEESENPERHAPSAVAPLLCSRDLSYARLAELLSRGWRLRATRLSPEFDLQSFRDRMGDKARALMLLTEDGEIQPILPLLEQDRAVDMGVLINIAAPTTEPEATIEQGDDGDEAKASAISRPASDSARTASRARRGE